TSRYWSRNEWFCAGSSTSSSAAEASPRQSAPTLSTSSSMITGFIVPASRRARTSRPGNAPMYVRRWPRISASSRTPPSDIRTNSRLSARAIDSPTDVLPVPGGPIRVRIAPERLSSAMPRSWRSLRTARYSTIRSLTSSSPAWSASSTSRARIGSRRSSERLPHGTASSQSRYVRIIDDSDGLQQLDLLLEAQIRRIAGRVGERSRLANGANKGRNALVAPTQLEDLFDDRAVLDLELARLDGRRRLVRTLLDLDAQPPGRIGDRRADQATVETGNGHGLHAAGKADPLDDLRDRTHFGVLVVVLGHEHDALLVADL